MKSRILFIIIGVFLAGYMALGLAKASQPQEDKKEASQEYAAGEVLVKFREGADTQSVLGLLGAPPENMQRVHSIAPATAKYKKDYKLDKDSDGWFWFLGKNYKEAKESEKAVFNEAYKKMSPQERSLYRTYKVRLPEGVNVEQAVNILKTDPNIEYAQPNYIINKPAMVPDDPQYPHQWNLKFSKLNCEPAWDLNSGSQGNGVTIAVLDTGVQYLHEDLAANMWSNPGEIPDNGIDDDGNDYIDDIYGYDFTAMDNDPQDDYQGGWGPFFHGTQCAGIAAAVGNNQLGIIGVAPKAKIMAVRMMPSTTEHCVQAIKYAVDNGAKVLSISWGYRTDTDAEVNAAFDYAYAAGCVTAFAAGNYDGNIDRYFLTPPKFIVVSATDSADNFASAFSDYGEVVSVSAPGANIWTTLPKTIGTPAYYEFTGTSAAAPHVAGIAALIFSINPNLSNDMARQIIEVSSDDLGDPGKDIYFGYGRVNAYMAALHANIDLSISAPEADTVIDREVDISGTAFIDSGFQRYEVYYYSDGHADNPTLIYSSNAPVRNGILAHWNNGALPAGEYVILLKVYTVYNKVFSCLRTVNIPERPMLGNLQAWVYNRLCSRDARGRTTCNSRPVANAAVRIEGNGINRTLQEYEPGRYRADNLPVGSYTITVSKTGFIAQTRAVTIQSGQTMNPGFSLVAEYRKGALSGRVHYQRCRRILFWNRCSWEPLSGATIRVMVSGQMRSAVTNSSGYYRLDNLLIGDYTVNAYKTGYNSSSKRVAIVENQVTQADFNMR